MNDRGRRPIPLISCWPLNDLSPRTHRVLSPVSARPTETVVHVTWCWFLILSGRRGSLLAAGPASGHGPNLDRDTRATFCRLRASKPRNSSGRAREARLSPSMPNLLLSFWQSFGLYFYIDVPIIPSSLNLSSLHHSFPMRYPIHTPDLPCTPLYHDQQPSLPRMSSSLTPNGFRVTDSPFLAPDGSRVTDSPFLAPDGSR